MLVRSMFKAILPDSFNYVLQSNLLFWSYFALIKTFGVIFSTPDNILGPQASILSFTCIFFSLAKTTSTKVLRKKKNTVLLILYTTTTTTFSNKAFGKRTVPILNTPWTKHSKTSLSDHESKIKVDKLFINMSHSLYHSFQRC